MMLAVPAAAVELQTKPIGEITFGVVLGILYLGVISTALAMLLWNQAFVLVEASVASLFFFAQPLVGVVLGSIVLQQAITLQIVIGGALIIAGVLLSMLPQPQPATQPSMQLLPPSSPALNFLTY